MSARIIPLPTAATEPVHNAPRRGRYPVKVTQIRYGLRLKLDAKLEAQKNKEALEFALEYYRVAKREIEVAQIYLREAQQRASKSGGSVSARLGVWT